MLEYVLTRGDDRRLFRHDSLRYLVLDEVHTYQGALGTEIACLVRRLRGHVDRATSGLVCVGLSATVYAGTGEEAHEAARRQVAEFASALFAANADSRTAIAYAGIASCGSVNPFAPKPVGRYCGRRIGVMSLYTNGRWSKPCDRRSVYA